MFGFIKRRSLELLSVCAIGSFGESLVSNSKGLIKCVSLSKHPCLARPTLVNINPYETLFFLFTVSAKKCNGSCNTIDDLYARVCLPNKVKNMNVTVFNLISGVKETRFLIRRESCKCNLGWMKVYVIQSKNQCECKELDDWGSCKNDYMWNTSTCHCECNKACKIDEYLDIKNCSCEKRLIGKLVLEYEDEILNTTEILLNDKKVACAKSYCPIHTISFVVICLLLWALNCVN